MTQNEKVQRLLEIKALISSLEKEKSAIETEIKDKGSFETRDFSVEVGSVTRYFPKGVDAMINAFGELALLQHEVISKSTFKTVKISKKEKAVA